MPPREFHTRAKLTQAGPAFRHKRLGTASRLRMPPEPVQLPEHDA